MVREVEVGVGGVEIEGGGRGDWGQRARGRRD